MRILKITWEYPPYVVGGMGKHVGELIPTVAEFASAGEDVQVDVLTPMHMGSTAKESVSENVTVYRVAIPPVHPNDLFNSVMQGNGPLLEQAHRLAEAHPYDLIHVHDWLVADVGITVKHEWRVPLVVTIHATERGRHQGHLATAMSEQINRLEWKVCFEAWKVIVCSHFMAQELHDFFKLPYDKTVVIPNGIDLEPFQQADAECLQHVRRRHAPHGERLLFFVGRIVFEKGLQVLLRAMPRILEQHADTVLLVAGKNGDILQPLVDELQIGDAVHFLGYISDEQRNQLYQVVDAAIFPSLYEPFGIVALEAMAAHCNVIASDVGGLTEVVNHMQNGLSVPPNDTESIAWAVNMLYADPESARRRRELAFELVKNQFNWPSITQRTLMLYRQVWEERRHVTWK